MAKKTDKKRQKTKPVTKPADAADTATSKQSVELQDLSGRLTSYNLEHLIYCKGSGSCVCEELTQRRPATGKDGRAGFKMVKKLISASITILPKGKSEPLHEAVLGCEQVKNAIRARPTVLRVIRG